MRHANLNPIGYITAIKGQHQPVRERAAAERLGGYAMNGVTAAAAAGLWVRCRSPREARALDELLDAHALRDRVLSVRDEDASSQRIHLCLGDAAARAWAPGHDTTRLPAILGLDTLERRPDLEREILVALLASPIAFDFPSSDELLAAIHIRRNIVEAGRRTVLDFRTSEAERPADCWRYDEDRGFVVRPGHSLIEALQKATQPGPTGQLYSFSCYRATEYVILLGIAEELALCNPPLLAQLQKQCETRVIRSGQFHDVFLREYGTQESPLPARYYVPGDRLWFRNPDEASSDVSGYEGSWVIYLGGGLFSNFWKRDRPYTLESKCLEIHHWRHGVHRDASGEPAMDEAIVERRVAASMADPAATARILEEMMRLREPKGCYGHGGCIDTTREAPRRVCPGTADLVLPDR